MDAACREHDIAYSQNNDLAHRHVADKVLAEQAKSRITARDSTLGERAAATAMKAQTKLGMGMKAKTKNKTNIVKKRILPPAKRGDILPILPMLGVLGSLAAGAAGVAKVNDNKTAQRQLQEMHRQ